MCPAACSAVLDKAGEHLHDPPLLLTGGPELSSGDLCCNLTECQIATFDLAQSELSGDCRRDSYAERGGGGGETPLRQC